MRHAGFLVFTLCLVSFPVTAHAADPVSDPLRGERRILPLDDVMMSYLPNGGATTELLAGLGTGTFIDEFLHQDISSSSNTSVGVIAGRMFARPRDTFVIAGSELTFVIGEGSPTPSFERWTAPLPHALPSRVPGNAVYRPQMAMADFNGDGYDELVIGAADRGLRVATPVDVTDPSKGLIWGDFLSPVFTVPGSSLTAGDLDGDGDPEVVLARPDGVAFVVGVYHVDPTELWLRFEHSVTVQTSTLVAGGFQVQQVSVVAADFDGDQSSFGLPDDEIVVAAGSLGQGSRHVAVQPYKVFSTLQPVAMDGRAFELNLGGGPCNDCAQYASIVADAARLDWIGSPEQLVLGVTTLDTGTMDQRSQIWIATFDSETSLGFGIRSQTTIQPNNFQDCNAGMRGLAIGNYDHPTATSSGPPTIPDTLEIAVLQGFDLGAEVGGSTCGHEPNVTIQPYTVDAKTWELSGPLGGPSTFFEQNRTPSPTFSLASGDFQGGSLRVGPPEIVPLQDVAQLEVVLQAPPMHIDYIQPVDTNQAELLNLSYGLPGFNTKFNETSGTTTTSTHDSTDSYSFAEMESLSASISFGIPDVIGATEELRETAKQTQEKIVSQSSSMITSTLQSLTAATDLNDRVWYTQQDLNLYYYPILCPPDPSNPNECDPHPAHLVFSVPQRQNTYSFVPAATVEWYQPPHQVGHVLSYPWTNEQVQSLFPTTDLDPKLDVQGLPAAGPLSTTFEWTGIGETVDSIGKERTLSFDTSYSISIGANAEVDVFSIGGETNDSFSFNASTSASTVNTTATKVEGKIGFATNVPDASDMRSGSNVDYGYDFDVSVFGQKHPLCPTKPPLPPEGKVCTFDQPPLTETVTTQGTLWAGYLADLSMAGNWWTSPTTDYFTHHDVALNHPQRWARDPSKATGSNCLTDSASDTGLCYVRSPSGLAPDEIWDNEFYQMKGLFVLPSEKSEAGDYLPPEGPQTLILPPDRKAWLRARIHNLSFVATDKSGAGNPTNNSVHVRFYAQEWDATNHVPAAGKQSVLVEEIELSQCIPGHGASTNPKTACANGGDANWVLATTSSPFDPTAAGIDLGTEGAYVLFWVLVWMEDPSGQLVAEVAEHGITSLPGELTSFTDAGSLSQMYGNNIGFFHAPVFICPSNAECSTASMASAAQSDGEESAASPLTVSVFDIPRDTVARNRPTRIRASLYGGNSAAGAVHVALWSNPMGEAPAIFDVELVPYLRSADRYLVSTAYRPKACGPHEIRLVADPGARGAPVERATELNVSVSARDELGALGDLLAGAGITEARTYLRAASNSFVRGRVEGGLEELRRLRDLVGNATGIPADVRRETESRVDSFLDCVQAAGGRLAGETRTIVIGPRTRLPIRQR